MTRACLMGVAHYLPAEATTYEELAGSQNWDLAKLSRTVGIKKLPRSAAGEFSSHLATKAAENLFASGACDRSEIDFVLLVTQTPDFPLPTTACLVQDALGLRQDIGALDVRLGCSGYVYALGLAKGLIESGQAQRVLLLTADVLTKVVNPSDKATAPIFGDAGTATLLAAAQEGGLGPVVYGTDGTGAGALVVPGGSLRPGETLNRESTAEARGLASQGFDLYMDGSAVFNFTLSVVPPLIEETISAAGWTQDEVDLFVLHQANRFMLQHLRKKMRIPEEQFWVEMENVGNTGPSTIPLAISQAAEAGRLSPGMRIVLAGFGVGLSWAGVTLTW